MYTRVCVCVRAQDERLYFKSLKVCDIFFPLQPNYSDLLNYKTVLNSHGCESYHFIPKTTN